MTEQPEKEGKRREREEDGTGWIEANLKWPKTEETGEKEGQEKGGRKGRPRENGEDLVAPSEYSDSDDEKPWVKPLLGECHGRGTCFCGCCLIVNRQKLWRSIRRSNLFLDRHVMRHQLEVQKYKKKIDKLESENHTLKSLRTVRNLKDADKK